MPDTTNHLSDREIMARALTTPSGQPKPGVSVATLARFCRNAGTVRSVKSQAHRENLSSLALTAALYVDDSISTEEMHVRFALAPAA